MIEKIKKTPLYPILADIYPQIHKIYIWLVWQLCYLLPVEHKKSSSATLTAAALATTPVTLRRNASAGRFLIKCIGSVKSLAAHFHLN